MIRPICVPRAESVGEFIASALDAAAGSNAFANPKSSTFTVPSGADLDVGGFQIAMDDALIVRGFEGLRDLLRDRQRVGERHRSARDQHREVVAFDEFHDQRAHAAQVLEAVDVRDIGMVQRREDLRFAFEASESIGVVGKGLAAAP